jgi:starch-binding outer membrane protein, SusD/RagB family
MKKSIIKTVVLAALMALPMFTKAQTFAGITAEQIAQNTPEGWTAKTEKNTCYRDIHIITLPEMYLVAAEAYLKAGDNPKALARLNEVHQRAGLSALTGTITIDDILDENACENFGNEARWMDLRRTQTLVTRCTKYNHEMGDKAAQYIGKKLLRPIPQAAIDANDQLTLADQNPGY